MPTALILCGRGNGFDQFLPADGSIERFGTNGQFYFTPERSAIIVDFALSEIQLDASTTQEADPYRAFYLSYYRFLIHRQVGSVAPAWFEEGLVQIFAATEFNRKWITFAQIGDGFGGEKIGDYNRMLNERSIISFKEFLEEQPKVPVHDAFWAAQCYGFVHLCLYGMNQKYQKGFIQYLKKLETEQPSEAMFKACFGKSYKDMALELRGYVGFTNYKAMQYRAKKGQELPAPPDVNFVDAPDAVVGRIKGETLRLAGRSELAHNTLIAPYVRGERDPRLLAALGLDEIVAGRDARARKFLEAAAAAKVDRARAYLELARLRLAEVRAKPAAPGGKLDAKQLGFVLEPLQVARTQPPRMSAVYALLAEAWMQSAEPLTLAQLGQIADGVRFFPRDAALVQQVALLAAARGFPAQAADLAKYGLRIAKTDAQRDQFQLLSAAVARDEQEKKTAPAATPPPPAEPKPSPFAR